MSPITIEQKQEIVLTDASMWASDVTMGRGPLCAWCLSERGMVAGDGSHGICTQHAERLLRQWRERGGRRRR